MSKNLLTALLIAGMSATAKAEPTVYYCNTTAFADIVGSETEKIKSYPFKLFVDLQNEKIKMSAEFGDSEASGDQIIPWDGVFNCGEDAFFVSNLLEVFDFKDNTLAYAKIGFNQHGETSVRAFMARCDKF